MPNFVAKMKLTFLGSVYVKANTKEEAIAKIKEGAWDGEVVLDELTEWSNPDPADVEDEDDWLFRI